MIGFLYLFQKLIQTLNLLIVNKLAKYHLKKVLRNRTADVRLWYFDFFSFLILVCIKLKNVYKKSGLNMILHTFRPLTTIGLFLYRQIN